MFLSRVNSRLTSPFQCLLKLRPFLDLPWSTRGASREPRDREARFYYGKLLRRNDFVIRVIMSESDHYREIKILRERNVEMILRLYGDRWTGARQETFHFLVRATEHERVALTHASSRRKRRRRLADERSVSGSSRLVVSRVHVPPGPVQRKTTRRRRLLASFYHLRARGWEREKFVAVNSLRRADRHRL